MPWNDIKDLLKDKLPETVHKLWIEPISCIQEDESLLELACPDRFFYSWVKENYLSVIQESLVQLGRPSQKVRLRVGQAPANCQPALLEGGSREQLRLPAMPEAKSYIRNLHPRYTVE